MKIKKGYVILLIVLVLSCLVSAADKITVWLTGHSNEEIAIIRSLTETTFTAQTGIAVDFSNLSWSDFENRFLMAAASGDAPDVGGAGTLFLPELGVRGALIDLTKMPGFQEVFNRAAPNFYRALQYKGLTFGIPYTASATVAFQRDDILKEVGIKSINTWDELKQVLPKLQAKNSNFTLQWFLSDTVYSDVNMFMWQHGADDYDPTLTKSGYDSPECIAGFKEYAELYTKYKIPKEAPVFQSFVKGELAIVLQSPGFYQNLIQAAPQLTGKWSMVEVPGTYNTGKINNTTVAGAPSAIGIFEASKKKNQSWEFIKWLTDEKIQVEIASQIMTKIKGALFLPTNRDAVTKINLNKEATVVFAKALNNGNCSIYGLVAPRNRRRYLQMAAQKAILNGVDPEKAIREAADEHNAEIKKKQVEYDRYIKRLLEQQKK